VEHQPSGQESLERSEQETWDIIFYSFMHSQGDEALQIMMLKYANSKQRLNANVIKSCLEKSIPSNEYERYEHYTSGTHKKYARAADRDKILGAIQSCVDISDWQAIPDNHA